MSEPVYKAVIRVKADSRQIECSALIVPLNITDCLCVITLITITFFLSVSFNNSIIPDIIVRPLLKILQEVEIKPNKLT